MEPERKKYKNDFLKQVIARVDFDAPAEVRSGVPKEVVDILRERFPIQESTTAHHLNVHLDGETLQRAQEERTVWEFHSKPRDKKLVIREECMFVEYKSYDCYETLLDDFLGPATEFLRARPGLSAKRLGLRYIDDIRISGVTTSGWEKFLDESLLCSLSLVDEPENLGRMLNLLQFNQGDWQLKFQYGLVNEDFPAPIRKWGFILDTDAYCQLLLEATELKGWLDKFHDAASNWFERIIKEPLRTKMELVTDE